MNLIFKLNYEIRPKNEEQQYHGEFYKQKNYSRKNNNIISI